MNWLTQRLRQLFCWHNWYEDYYGWHPKKSTFYPLFVCSKCRKRKIAYFARYPSRFKKSR